MSSMARFDLSIPVSEATLNGWLRLIPGRSPDSLQRISSYFAGIAGGPFAGSCLVTTGAVQATATITSTGSAVNNETMLLGNVTLTAKTSGAVAANGEFNISGTVATQATNIAAAINAVAGLSGVVTATSALGVVTVTSVVPGTVGNGLQISESLTNVTATAFSGGVDGTNTTVSNGY